MSTSPAADYFEVFRRATATDFGEVTTFISGSSHRDCYRTTSSDGDLIFKVNIDSFLTSRYGGTANEFEVGRIAAEAGLAPRPVWFTQDVIVEEFIEGKALDWSEDGLWVCLELSHSLAEVSARHPTTGLHHSSLLDDVMYSALVCQGLRPSQPSVSDLAIRTERNLRTVARAWSRDTPDTLGLPIVLTHADLSPDNVISFPGGNVLVDFEMSGYCRSDYVFGQLAVDALIEDHLAARDGRSYESIWSMIADIRPEVPERVRVARTIERLGFNAAYALRQVDQVETRKFPDTYIDRKTKVALWCINELESLMKEWGL